MLPDADWKTALQDVLDANREMILTLLRQFAGSPELDSFGFVVVDPQCPILANDPPTKFECRMLRREQLADMLEFGASTDAQRAAAYRALRERVVSPAPADTLWCIAMHREGMTLTRVFADPDASLVPIGDA